MLPFCVVLFIRLRQTDVRHELLYFLCYTPVYMHNTVFMYSRVLVSVETERDVNDVHTLAHMQLILLIILAHTCNKVGDIVHTNPWIHTLVDSSAILFKDLHMSVLHVILKIALKNSKQVTHKHTHTHLHFISIILDQNGSTFSN